MLEAAFRGGKRYWGLLGVWGVLILVGLVAWSRQFTEGLTVTGMTQDVTWGIYIAQFTFLVGVAASAVMVVLPYYLHNYKTFGRMVILGEGLAIAAVSMCSLFIFVDMGQPTRVTNVFLHPTLNSMMFWDSLALMGYLVLNLIIGAVTFDAERKEAPPPRWIKPIIILSIPWAVSIHTVTAFLYSGLEARTFWMTAILAPRFLASAFASGPSLLILLALIMRRFTKFDPGETAIRKLAVIVAYAMTLNLFFVGVELFTALYSDMPHHVHAFEYLYVGLHGYDALVPWMWTGAFLTLTSVTLLLIPRVRNNLKVLGPLCLAVILAIWIEKGVGMVVTGFVPNPLGHVTEYSPTGVEIAVTAGVYAIGAMILTMIYKIVVNVRERMLVG
ncbi:sulfate reduction electron transfer complex DsrMKJOP subunit DsrP [Gemmatimonadota bacterium]